MVERLKIAIDKARASRAAAVAAGSDPASSGPASSEPAASGPAGAEPDASEPSLWATAAIFIPDPAQLQRERIVTRDKSHPAHAAFDVLRTRLLRVCREKGWRRIGITAATAGCGKSMVCANLAFSSARSPERRILVIDLDLRAPRLARLLGAPTPAPLAAFLAGEIGPETHLRRVGDNLMFCLNGKAARNSAELLQSAAVWQRVAEVERMIEPDLTLIDLPPMLGGDDAIACAPQLDAVLLVAAAGATTPVELRECERLIGGATALLGVVLNKLEGPREAIYPYGEQ